MRNVKTLTNTMSRTKSVFRSSEIAHIWANKRAPEGRSPGNMSFCGDVIYSFATVIARHITHKGKPAIIFNETGYSSYTSKTQSAIRRAIPNNIPVFRIGGLTRGVTLDYRGADDKAVGKHLFEYSVHRATESAAKATRARTHKDFHLGEQSRHLEHAKEIAAFFGLRTKIDERTIERLAMAKARAEKIAAEKQRIRMEKDRKEQQEAYEAWKAGDGHRHFYDGNFPTAFRIEDRELVSTRGARIPLSEARLAVRFIRNHRANGWKTNGEEFTIGGYQLIQISEKEIHVGCHHITWEEFDRIAPQITIACAQDSLAEVPGAEGQETQE